MRPRWLPPTAGMENSGQEWDLTVEGVTGKLKLLQTAFFRGLLILWAEVHFLKEAQYITSVIPGGPGGGGWGIGRGKEEGLQVFNLENLHSWNKDTAHLRSNSTGLPVMEGVSGGGRDFTLGLWFLMLSSGLHGRLLLGVGVDMVRMLGKGDQRDEGKGGFSKRAV